MNLSWMVSVTLALAFGICTWRIASGAPTRRIARLLLLAASVLLLYASLLPPSTQKEFLAGELVVLTPGATPAQKAALSPTSTVVALPGSEAGQAVESVPDLGTALRRHPEAQRLRIVGAGLPPRDRDAARGRVARFDAAPLLTGVVELHLPASTRAGSTWRVDGRIEAVAHARVELRDPASTVVATAAVDDAGRFAIQGPSKVPGHVLFSLRVLDDAGTHIEDVRIPLITTESEPLRVLLVAGAPDPELKYLRRWASDAGIAIDSRVALTEGIALTEGAAALDASALKNADVAILDERSWDALDGTRKARLLSAVSDGLGLVLRVTGPIDARVVSEWAALGFATRASDVPTSVLLEKELGIGDATRRFTRRAIAVDAADAAPLLRADDGSALALWRARGQGRIALWWLTDSWTLVTAGESARFATLWGETLATLARARGPHHRADVVDARVGERVTLCGVAAGDVVENVHGGRTTLVIDSAASAGCAGYWPSEAGWHTWISGDVRQSLYVRAATDALALERADDARATRALISGSTGSSLASTRAAPMPRWPFFLAWLTLIAALWWIERRSISGRKGRVIAK